MSALRGKVRRSVVLRTTSACVAPVICPDASNGDRFAPIAAATRGSDDARIFKQPCMRWQDKTSRFKVKRDDPTSGSKAFCSRRRKLVWLACSRNRANAKTLIEGVRRDRRYR